MRIAVWHDLPSGGGLRALVGQANALRARGHELAVWTPRSHVSDRLEAWWPRELPTTTMPFEGGYRPSYIDRRFAVEVDLVRWRRNALQRHGQEVVGAMTRWGAAVMLVHPSWWFHASPLAQAGDLPSVLFLQEPNRPLYEASPSNLWAEVVHPPGTRLRTRLGARLRDMLCNSTRRAMVRHECEWVASYDRVLVNSLYSRESVMRAYGLDSVYCPHGVDHSVFASTPRQVKRPVVVSLGQMARHKDARLAVQAVATIPEHRRPPLRWFGNRGGGTYQRDVESLARDAGVDFECHIGVSDAELSVALASAACLVYCPRLEPLGLAPLEANLAGTATVGIAEGGVRETTIPGINGTLVYNRDPVALGAAIDRYTSDLAFAEREGEKARAHVTVTHTWRRAGEVLEAELIAAMQIASQRRLRQGSAGA